MIFPIVVVGAVLLDFLALKAYGIPPRNFQCPTNPQNLNPAYPQFACAVSFGGYAEGGFGSMNVAGAPADYDTGGDPQDGPKDNQFSDTPDGPLRSTLTCNYRNVDTAPFGGVICNYETTGVMIPPNNSGCPELCPVAVSSSTLSTTSSTTSTTSASTSTTSATGTSSTPNAITATSLSPSISPTTRCISNKASIGRLCEIYGDISDIGGSICPGFRNIKDSFINGLQGVIVAAETNNQANPAAVQAQNTFKYLFFTTIAASLGVAAVIAEAPAIAIGVAALEAFTIYCDVIGYVSLISSACNIVKNKFACPNPRLIRSLPLDSVPVLQPKALASGFDNPCTSFLSMLPPASICTRLQPLVSCTLTLADYLEGGISQSEAQDLIDACPTLLQSQKDIQSLCQLRQAVAGFEPFCAPEPYVPSNSTMNCPTGKCNSTGSVDVIEYVTVVTCDICQTSLGAVYTPAVVPCGICVGGSATVQPPHLAGCPTCAGGSTRIPPHYEVPCMTCPGGSSAVIVTVQPATTYLTQATAAAVNPTVNILATPKYTDVAFPGAATRSKALFSLPVVIVVVLCGLMIL